MIIEDKPPILRFVETSEEDKIATEQAGITQYKNVTKVYTRTPGDMKFEHVDIAREVAYEVSEAEIKVEKEITVYKRDPKTGELKETTEVMQIPEIRKLYTKKVVFPRLEKLREKLKDGRISQNYFDHYVQAWERFLRNEEAPIVGTPLVDWRGAPEAVKRRAIEIGIRSVEDAADMDDATIQSIGMGARDLKNRAVAFLDQDVSKVKSAQKMNELQDQNQRMAEQLSALQQKLEELSSRRGKAA